MKYTETETHEIPRGDSTLTLEVTYTPKTGRPIRMYRLIMRATGVTGERSPFVFVYHRAADGAPMEDGSPRDEFLCVADELDEDELPTEEQGPDPEHGMPYYRSDSVELLFRTAEEMREAADGIIRSLTEL